jgi:uncharacterized SAM-binding protein YcdF (DUF218 family)
MKNRSGENIMNKFRNVLKGIFIALGFVATVMIILAFTSVPFWIWHHMGTKEAGISRPPDYIVALGGGGMPSESGLMRTWYAAGAAGYFTRAKVIIALPGDPSNHRSALHLMYKELVMRGISPDRILLEDSGTNTRSQALNILKRISDIEQQKSILLVTSPEHLYRSVLTFKKAGFYKVEGLPCFEQAIESDITFNAEKLGGRKYIPDIGNNIALRYQFWTQMNYEFLILREWSALGYYKLKGWI